MEITDLVAKAGLPAITEIRPLSGGRGMDNRLSLVSLSDDRQVLARQPIYSLTDADPAVRSMFLRQHQVGAPEVYATAEDGSVLVEWIPGMSLADFLAMHGASSPSTASTWRRLGTCMAAVHRLRFPAPLQGKIGPSTLVLRPADPVDGLTASLNASTPWIEANRPALVDAIAQLRRLIDRYTERIRAEQPCLIHADANFDNIVVNDHAVRLVDWDFPEIGYPLRELSNLDQQAYLNGAADGLPAEFWDGYGRTYPAKLMLVYRGVRCLSRLAATDWSDWETDPDVSDSMKAELRRRHGLLEDWGASLPTLLADVDPAEGR